MDRLRADLDAPAGPPPRPLAVAPRDHRVDRALVVVVALVIIAVMKPWGLARPSPAPPDPRVAVASAPVAPTVRDTATPATLPRSATPAFPCYWPSGWRVVVLDRELGWTVRTWIAATPAVTSSPADRAIPRISLAGSDPIAVGFCAPASGAEAAAWTGARPRIQQAWRLSGAGAGTAWRRIVTSSLGDTGSRDLEAVRTADGGAFAVLALVPSGGSADGRPGLPGGGPADAWPAGRYVVAVGPPDGAPLAWFGLDVGSGVAAIP